LVIGQKTGKNIKRVDKLNLKLYSVITEKALIKMKKMGSAKESRGVLI